MLHRIAAIETKLVYACGIAVILLHLVSLYYIIDLFSYDEITGYLTSGEEKSTDPADLAYLFFLTSILGLLFVSVSLIAYLSSKYYRTKK